MIEYKKEYDNVLDELKDRGYFDNATDEAALRDLLGKGPVKFYIGFDASRFADDRSLHSDYGFDAHASLRSCAHCSVGRRHHDDR